jgi:ferritin-like metal-binding protein YciE
MQAMRELLIDQMKDMYDAEKQLVKALPKMAKAAANDELSQAFEEHLEQTRGHVERIERAFEMLGEKAKSRTCEAMKGLVEEGQEAAKVDFDEPLVDSAIICSAQKVEHYEIAAYGTLSAWSKHMGLNDVAELFDETLEEEKAADEKLTELNTSILSEISMEEPAEEGEEVRRKGAAAGRGSTGSRRRAS